ncbi:MAG: alpha/beta fold hydrolase [Halothiobacillaceae bacterium]
MNMMNDPQGRQAKPDPGSSRTLVILIHGLWMGRWIMRPLATRLERAGMQTRLFGYHSVIESSEAIVARLDQLLRASDAGTIHLVAHSLGGLLVGAYLQQPAPDPRIGRIVTIGTPHQGSAIARTLGKNRLTRSLVGANTPLLQEGLPHWLQDYPTLSIAGTRRLGVDSLLRVLPHPDDGTVAVAETRLPPPAHHATFGANHSGLLFSRAVADCVIDFLQDVD